MARYTGNASNSLYNSDINWFYEPDFLKKSPDAVHQGFLVVARERLELSASGL